MSRPPLGAGPLLAASDGIFEGVSGLKLYRLQDSGQGASEPWRRGLTPTPERPGLTFGTERVQLGAT